jgi:hypothetical protein
VDRKGESYELGGDLFVRSGNSLKIAVASFFQLFFVPRRQFACYPKIKDL